MLQALGVVFLIVLAALAAGVAWIFFKIKRGLLRLERTAALADSLGGPQLLLESRAQIDWPHADTINELRDQSIVAGATHIGDYAVPAMAGTFLCGYVVEAINAFLTVYDNPQLEPWVDVIVCFADGSSYTASTAKSFGPGAPRPSEDELERFPSGTDIATLITAVDEQAIGREVEDAVAENFQPEFEAMCEKHRLYIANQPVNQAWLDAIAVEAGVELDGDEAADLDRFREECRIETMGGQCIRDLAASGNYSAAEWEAIRDHLVVVHDSIPADEVADVILENVDLDDAQYERAGKLNDGAHPPRRAVARFNMTLPETTRLKLVRTVDSPMAADIYINQMEYAVCSDLDLQFVERETG